MPNTFPAFVMPQIRQYYERQVVRMNDTIYRLLRTDGSITTNKNLIFGIGLNEAIIYSELLSRYYYFEDKEQLQPDGSFFNTIDDLYLGTGLGDRAQRTAINNLKKFGLLDSKNKGVPPKRYFLINFDNDTINYYLNKGKSIIESKKQEIKAKSETNHWNNSFPAIAEIKDSKQQETNIDSSRRNNTKVNNTKDNNTKSLHQLSEIDDNYISFYLEAMKEYGYKHKRLSIDNLLYVDRSIQYIKGTVDIEEWKEAVRDHFDTLSKRNDGDIMAFLKASKRYFNLEV